MATTPGPVQENQTGKFLSKGESYLESVRLALREVLKHVDQEDDRPHLWKWLAAFIAWKVEQKQFGTRRAIAGCDIELVTRGVNRARGPWCTALTAHVHPKEKYVIFAGYERDEAKEAQQSFTDCLCEWVDQCRGEIYGQDASVDELMRKTAAGVKALDKKYRFREVADYRAMMEKKADSISGTSSTSTTGSVAASRSVSRSGSVSRIHVSR